MDSQQCVNCARGGPLDSLLAGTCFGHRTAHIWETRDISTINRIFDLLDDWRHLPCYQLERRADIFFAPFLPEFLEHSLRIRINPTLIPEFPLRKQGNNQSCKVDYLALAADRSAAFLIELKTDNASRREGQVSERGSGCNAAESRAGRADGRAGDPR